MPKQKKAKKGNDVSIIVNTRKKKWNDAERLSYEQVAEMAFGSCSNDENTVYTITCLNGHTKGSLVKGKSVKAKDGMIFNVTQTNRS